ncbi:MAG TPA: T9SS type A sorting domain-containing protein [Edaphocola sp.]|nr:T9SS type A sorting domain-containing protein [Edaphocola sp.]
MAENDNWGQARINGDFNTIYLDKNIEVSDGTVKLKMYKENATWNCDTCTAPAYNTNYTGAYLTLPYWNYFNHGKFEARIKMPTFHRAHCTFWTYHGQGVNEIDIAEASGYSAKGMFNSFPSTGHYLHAWWEDRFNNPNNFPENIGVGQKYPGQSWFNWNLNKNFVQSNWNVYGAEWDTNVIRFYLDHDLVYTYWKYYKRKKKKKYKIKFGSTCYPENGEFRVLEGYPWNDTSASQLRLNAKIEKEEYTHSDGFLGQMEVDYVKMWQRIPHNTWISICDNPSIYIGGPNAICNTSPTTFSISNPSPTGYWEASYNLNIVSQSHTMIKVTVNPAANLSIAWIKYYPYIDTCPENNSPVFVTKVISTKKFYPEKVVLVKLAIQAYYFYKLHAMFETPVEKLLKFVPNTNLKWTIDYGPNLANLVIQYGRSAYTPLLPNSDTLDKIKWKLEVTNDCGTSITIDTGTFLGTAIVIPAKGEITSMLQVGAKIPDTSIYEFEVQSLLDQTMLSINATESEIDQHILEYELIGLEPYLIFDTVNLIPSKGIFEGVNNNTTSTFIFPNPTKTNLSIMLGNKYHDNAHVFINLTDNFGRKLIEKRIPCQKFSPNNLNLENLANGTYFLNIKQDSISENFKIVKIED